MKTGIKVSGFDDLIADIGLTGKAASDAVDMIIGMAAFKTHKYAVEGILSGVAAGIVYQKYNPRGTHRASAPGQYPASDTGGLAYGIKIERERSDLVRVGTASNRQTRPVSWNSCSVTAT